MLKRFFLSSCMFAALALFVSCSGDDSRSCETRNCIDPPEDKCDGEELTSYQLNGYCGDNDRCQYASIVDPCGCVPEGEECSTSVDPCEYIVCDQPPIASCRGDELVGFSSEGSCSERECSYNEVVTDCAEDGQICFNGACTDTSCAQMTCADPPDALCESNDQDHEIAVIFAALGQCSNASCSYPSQREDCTANGQSCENGVCRDLCAGLLCVEPPAAFCDENHVVDYAEIGVCDGITGECSYEETSVSCGEDVCVDGLCVVTCDGVVCDNVPPSYCDIGVAITYVSESCVEGECFYEELEENCAGSGRGCLDGECNGFCEGIICADPPFGVCEGNVSVYFSEEGICSEDSGECVYSEIVDDCSLRDEQCEEGYCTNACAGISCISAPARTCEGNVAHGFEIPGTCASGECSYETSEEDCSENNQICRNGLCVSSCDPSLCNDPPGLHCDGEEVVSYNANGQCQNNECVYFESDREDCSEDGNGCSEGACVADPCDDLTCTTPPAPHCDGETSVRYLPMGTCLEGECSYTERQRDCSETDEICLTGYCYDACDTLECNEPPANSCVNETLITWDPTGICEDASCSYSSSETDCSSTGLICVDAQCINPCHGVSCSTPPAAECRENIRIIYSGSGRCEEGICLDFPFTEADCESYNMVCEDGACVDDPCDNIDCNDPPDIPPVCNGNITSYYATNGSCNNGTCEYFLIDEDCEDFGTTCNSDTGLCVLE